MRQVIKLTAFCLFFQVILPPTAYAYLDPGSGSYLLQTIIGIVLGGTVGIGLFFKQIKDFIKRILVNNERSEETK